MRRSVATALALLALAARASAATVEVRPDDARLEVSPSIEVFEDPGARLTLEEAKNAEFRPWGGAGVPSFGFTTSAVWARATLANASDAPLVRWLEVDQPNVDDLRLWVDGEGPRIAGRVHPLGSGELRRRTYTFRIELPPRAARTLHLRVSGENELQFPLVLWTGDALAAHDATRALVVGLLYGLLLAMALYNLFVFAYVRAPAHLYYSLDVLAFGVWLSLLDGTLPLLLPDSLGVLPRWPFSFGVLGTIAALQFTRASLELRAARPKLDRLFRGAILFQAAWIVVGNTLVSWRVQNVIGTVVFAIAVGLLIITTGVLRWRDGLPAARFFTIGWSLLWLFLVLSTLSVSGLVPVGALGLLPHIGFTLEALTLALGLADATRRRNEHIARLNEAGRRFVPFEFLALLGRRELPEVRENDQVEREMTVFFSDVRGFTSLVEGLAPAETIRFVNDYLRTMEPPITAAGGFIDKYIGDAVMALFERPEQALAAARGCLAALEQLNAERAKGGLAPVRVGIGLHTGRLMLGTVGGARRLACTVIGDSVNLASRVESLTKLYGTPILLTEATARALPETLREIDRVAVKGRHEAVALFDALPRSAATRAEFEAGREALARGEATAARDAFERVLAIDPHDGPARALYERASAFVRDGVPEGWDGAWRATAK